MEVHCILQSYEILYTDVSLRLAHFTRFLKILKKLNNTLYLDLTKMSIDVTARADMGKNNNGPM